MSTEIPAVEKEVVAAAPQQEVDYEALLKEKDEAILKVTAEKENYRKGLLQAKGKIPVESHEDDGTPEELDAKVSRLVREALLSTEEAQARKAKDEAIAKVLKRNKELELALKNRSTVASPSGAGSNEEKPEVKTDSVLSKEQLASLKAKGWDDKKIESFKKNLQTASAK